MAGRLFKAVATLFPIEEKPLHVSLFGSHRTLASDVSDIGAFVRAAAPSDATLFDIA